MSSGEVYGFGRSPPSPDGSTVRINIDRVKAIADGESHGLALRDDGTVMAWGDNLFGRVGVASADGLPAPIPGLTNVVEVNGAEFHGMALTRSGAV